MPVVNDLNLDALGAPGQSSLPGHWGPDPTLAGRATPPDDYGPAPGAGLPPVAPGTVRQQAPAAPGGIVDDLGLNAPAPTKSLIVDDLGLTGAPATPAPAPGSQGMGFGQQVVNAFAYPAQRFNAAVGGSVAQLGGDVGLVGGKLADLTANAPLLSEALRTGSGAIQRGAEAFGAQYPSPGPPADVGQQITGQFAGALGAVPALAATSALTGPRAAFAGLAALEAAKRTSDPTEIGLEAIKGYLTAEAMEATGPLTRAPRAVAQAAVGAAQEPEHPLEGATTMAALGQLGGPGEQTARDVVAQLPGAAGAAGRAANLAEHQGLIVDDLGSGPAPAEAGPVTAPEAPGSTQEPPAGGRLIPELAGRTLGLGAAEEPAQEQGAPEPLVTRSEADQAASPEAINRLQSERGSTFERVDTRSGRVVPMPATVDRIDQLQAGPYDVVRKVAPDGTVDPVSIGEKVQPARAEQYLQDQGTTGKIQPEPEKATGILPGEVSQPAAAPAEPTEVTRLPLSEIQVDPNRFQARRTFGAGGASGSLAHVTELSQVNQPSLGNLLVWRDPADGKTYLVDGHNRFDMLQRMGASGARVAYLTDAENATEARVQGAMVNLRQGSYSPVDVAQVLRDTQATPAELRAAGVPLTRAEMRDGLGLANLHPALFGMVARGEMPVSRGSTIGREMGGEPEEQAQQLALVEMLGKRRGQLTDAEVAETIRQTKMAPTTTETQSGLFGDEQLAKSLAVERAQVIAGVREQLGRDKRLFSFVSQGERAARLKEEGTEVNTGRAQQVAQQSGQVAEIFDRLANRQGGVSDVVNDAARQIAEGTSTADAVARALPAVRDAVRAELTGGGPGGAVGAGAGAPEPEGGGTEGAEPGLFARLRSEEGAVTLPNPREWVQKGRAFVAQVYQEQAQAQAAALAQQIEASRQRSTIAMRQRAGPTEAGTNRAPRLADMLGEPSTEGRDYLGREYPQTEGNLQAPGFGRDTERLAPSIGEAFGPEADELLHGIAGLTRGDVEYARRGVVHDTTLRATAGELASDWIARANDDPRLISAIRGRGEALNDAQLMAALELNKHFMTRFATEAATVDPGNLEDLLKVLRLGLLSKEALTSAAGEGRLAIAGHQAVDALLQATGATAEAGRSLRTLRLMREQSSDQRTLALNAAARRLLGTETPEDARAKLAELMVRVQQFDPNDTVALNRLLSDLQGRPLSDAAYRYMRNAYLSALPGRTATMLSDAMMALRRPLGTLTAAPVDAIRALLTGTPREIYAGQAAADMVGMYAAMPNAARAFLRTLITQQPASGYSGGILEHGAGQVPPEGALGRALNLPVTFVSAMREGWKEINAGGYLASRAFQLSAREGLSGDDLDQSMAAIMRHPERVEGLLSELAQEKAYRTWESPNVFADASMDFRRKVPGLRWIFPFIQTPVNLANRVVQDVLEAPRTGGMLIGTLLNQTPAAGTRLQKAFGEIPSGAEGSEQVARAASGMLIGGAIAALAHMGYIIGTGPPSEAEQRRLRATGWQPNSVKVGDQYLGFNRLDPAGSFLSLVADLEHGSRIAMTEPEDAWQKIGVLFAHDLAANFVNKTYLRGLADVLDLIMAPEEHPNIPGQMIGGAIPAGISNLARAMDPTERSARTLKDVLAARLPGFREQLMPIRDVWGLPIVEAGGIAERLVSPIERRVVLEDPATRELERVGYVPGSPIRSLDIRDLKTPLTAAEYDRYVEMQGQLAHKLATQVIASAGYQRLTQQDTALAQNLQRGMFEKIFRDAREVARARTLPSVLPRNVLERQREAQEPAQDFAP